jgi:predicted nucleic acid-binding protein
MIKECDHPRASLALRALAEQPPCWLIVSEVDEVEADLWDLLDAGEATAITLAQRLRADVILIDEQDGRRCALARGFITAGTLIILGQAGVRGWFDFPATVEQLRTETNFRTTQAVVDYA